VIGFRRGRVSHLPRGALGEDVNDVLPTERAELPLFDIEVAGASPILGGLTAPVDVLVAQGGVESTICFSNFLNALFVGLFEVNKVTYAIPHLAFCLLNEEGFSGAHKGRALFRRDDGDMAGDEGVVGGGDDSGFHNERY